MPTTNYSQHLSMPAPTDFYLQILHHFRSDYSQSDFPRNLLVNYPAMNLEFYFYGNSSDYVAQIASDYSYFCGHIAYYYYIHVLRMFDPVDFVHFDHPHK